MIKQPITVIVCRVGRLPVVEPLFPDQSGVYFPAMRAIMGCALVQIVRLEDGLECYCNEEAILYELPMNRILMPAHGVAEMFRGDFIIAKTVRVNGEPEFVDLDDRDWLRYLRAFEAEDIETARRQNAERNDSTSGGSG
jgi:hypothetical protein